MVYGNVFGALGVPYTAPTSSCTVMHNTRVVSRIGGGEHLHVGSLEECIDRCISKVCTYEGVDCYLEHREVAGFAYHEGMEGIVCAGAILPDTPDRTAHIITLSAAVAVALVLRILKVFVKRHQE